MQAMDCHTGQEQTEQSSPYWALVGISAIALLLRVLGLPGRRLWYDEIQSVTHAGLPIRHLLRSVQTFDPHPPLYYLQLHFWMLLGTADWWIKLNSVFWSVLTVVSIFFLCRELFERKHALVASLLFAVSPLAIFYAQEARMYAWLMVLAVWGLYFTHRFLVGRRVWDAIGIVVVVTAFLYSHGAAFLLLASLYGYAALELVRNRVDRAQALTKYALLQIPILLLYLPWLWRASDISVGHALRPGANDVADTLFVLTSGVNRVDLWVKWTVVLLATALILWGVWRAPSVRSVAISFLLVPLVVCLAISYLYRPIWLYRTLAYTVPFLSIVFAFALLEVADALRRRGISESAARFAVIGPAVFLLLIAGGRQQWTYHNAWDIYGAAQLLKTEIQPGDAVYAPAQAVYWGIGWYLIGPRSIDPLSPNKSVDFGDGNLLVTRPALETTDPDRTYWVVYRTIDDLSPFAEQQLDSPWDFDFMSVARTQE